VPTITPRIGQVEIHISTDKHSAAPPSQWHEKRERENGDGSPLEMAVPGTHTRVLQVLSEFSDTPRNTTALDIGAGMGALSARLATAGYQVTACDLYPEAFAVEGIECRRVGLDAALPFDDASADVALAVEVMEHIDAHEVLFSEVRRVLKPGGLFLFTTPNILSLKSRLMFLLTGYFYSFPSLDPAIRDPVEQHITAFSLDRYRWRLRQAGLEFLHVAADKRQSTSKVLSFLAPLIWAINRKKARRSESVRLQNDLTVLQARSLIVLARRP